MEYELKNSHPLYIEMRVKGLVDKSGIIAALSELLRHKDYVTKHTLWDFSRATMGLSMTDMGEISGILKLFKPDTRDFADRSALVVDSAMNLSMVKVYISISRLLPFKYKAFNDKGEAIAFLTC